MLVQHGATVEQCSQLTNQPTPLSKREGMAERSKHQHTSGQHSQLGQCRECPVVAPALGQGACR